MSSRATASVLRKTMFQFDRFYTLVIMILLPAFSPLLGVEHTAERVIKREQRQTWSYTTAARRAYELINKYNNVTYKFVRDVECQNLLINYPI